MGIKLRTYIEHMISNKHLTVRERMLFYFIRECYKSKELTVYFLKWANLYKNLGVDRRHGYIVVNQLQDEGFIKIDRKGKGIILLDPEFK